MGARNGGWRGLSVCELSTTGYSRGVIGGPDSNAVAKLISDWLLTLNSQEGDSTWSEAVVTTQSANNVARDMQVLTEHVICFTILSCMACFSPLLE